MNKINFKFNSCDLKATLPDEAAQSVWVEIFKEREYKIAESVITNAVDPIIDVGAHIGLFSMYARTLNKKVSIFAIEPEEKNFELLNKNIKENKFTKVKTFQVALGGHSAETSLVVSADSHNHHLISAPTATSQTDQKETKQTTKMYSLQDFLDQQKITRVSLIKMDIEGGEYDVFSACTPGDFARLNAVIMEYHNYAGQNYKEIETRLRENGFGVQIFPSKFDKTMGFIFANNKRVK